MASVLLTVLAGLQKADMFHKGVCWGHGKTAFYNGLSEYATAEANASMRNLAATGATHIQIETAWYVAQCSSTALQPLAYTPTDASLVSAIQLARQLGLSPMLNTHIEVACKYHGTCPPGCGGRSDIDFGGNTSAWDRWFSSYTAFVRHHAALCERAGCALLTVHVELQGVGAALPDIGARWAAVIRSAREVFSGQLPMLAAS